MKKKLLFTLLFFNIFFSQHSLSFGQQANSCKPTSLPYQEQFNMSKDQLPTCTKVVTISGSSWKVDTGNEHIGIPGNALRRELSENTAGNTWFFTPGFSLEAGRVYVLSYKYMDPKVKAKNSLRIKLGTEQAVSGMAQDLNSHEISNQASATAATVEFSVETNGIYYIGFHAYSASQNEDSKLLLDDLRLSEKPREWTATPEFIDFPEATVGQTSAAQPLTIARINTAVAATLNLQVPADFQLSADSGSTWSSTLDVSYAAAVSAKTIQVRHVAATSCGTVTGNITARVAGAEKLRVPVTGSVISAPPVAMGATNINSTGFIANWQPAPGAANYRLDVSTSPAFETIETLNKGFGGGAQAPNGWVFTNIAGTYATNGNYGTSAPSLKLEKNSSVVSPSSPRPITSLKFWMKGEGTGSGSHLIIEGFNGTNWITIDDISALPTAGRVFIYDKNSVAVLPGNLKQIRWRYEKVTGNVAFDDVEIEYGNTEFQSFDVSGESSHEVTGLQPRTAYYYRVAVADPDCGEAISNIISVTTSRKSTVWNGTAWSSGVPDPETAAVITGSYDMKENGLPGFTSYSLDVAAPLVIRSNESVTVQTVLTGSAKGSITIEAGADFIQRENTANVYGGQFRLKQVATMKRLDYTYWGSPVAGQPLKVFSRGTLDNRFMTYNELTDTFTAVPSPANSVFAPAKGYAIRASNFYPVWTDAATATQVVFEGEFSGMPQNGEITYPLEANGRGFNLIANPYPSGLDFDLLSQSGTIEPVAHFWTNVNLQPTEQQGANYSGDNYATYTVNSGGSPAQNDAVENRPTGIIASGQGFMVKARKPADNLVFSNTMRTVSGSGSRIINKPPQQKKDRFWLQLRTPAGNFNTILIAYPEGATNGFESNSDAPQMSQSSDAFYSVLPDGIKLKIQGRQFPLDLNDEVSLGYSAFEQGQYQITLVGSEGQFAEDQAIYLEDMSSGTVVNLKTESYQFQSHTGTADGRFVIRYNNKPILGTGDNAALTFRWYISAKRLHVLPASEVINTEILDLAGRLLLWQDMRKAENTVDVSGLSSGVYIVKVTLSNKTQTFKIRL